MKCTYDIMRFVRFTFEDGKLNNKSGLFIYDHKNKCKSFTDKINHIPKNHREAESIAWRTDLNWIDCKNVEGENND